MNGELKEKKEMVMTYIKALTQHCWNEEKPEKTSAQFVPEPKFKPGT
jgi:hypothetical protein